MSGRSHAVGLRACCERLGISVCTGRRRLAAGTFPIPSLPRKAAGEHVKFSSSEIDRYFDEASVADARVRSRRSVRSHPADVDSGLKFVSGGAR